MRGSLTGDFTAFDRFSNAIGKLGSAKTMTDLNRELGNELAGGIQQSLINSVKAAEAWLAS